MYKLFHIPFLLLLLSVNCYAGGTRTDDGNQALKRMQYMLKQLTAEKAILEEEKANLKKDIESLEKDLNKANDEIAGHEITIQRREAMIGGLNGTIDKRNAKIAKREGQLKDVIGKYQNTVLLVHQLNADKDELQQTIADNEMTITDQEEKNLKLYQANLELMDLYQNKSGLESFMQKEKFTGFKQVQIENILQEYRFKLEDNKIVQQENN